MSLRVKTSLIIGFLLAINIFVSIANFQIQQDGMTSITTTISGVKAFERTIIDIHTLGDSIHKDILTAMLFQKKDKSEFLKELDRKSIEFYSSARIVKNLSIGETKTLQELVNSFQAYYIFAKRIYEANDFSSLDSDHEFMSHFLKRRDVFEERLEGVVVMQKRYTDDLVSEINEHMETMINLYYFVITISAILTLILIAVIMNSFISPIKSIQQFIKSIPDRGVIPKIGEELPNEFKGLASSFNEMADRLEVQERELVQTSTLEAMGRLAGGVAHDFNNILGSVMGCLHALKKHTHTNPIAQNELKIIGDLCHRGGDLTRKLLTTAKLDHRRDIEISITALINDLGMLLKRTKPGNVDFKINSEVEGLFVRADKGYLFSAILNVLTNAIDAVVISGGVVELHACKESKSSVMISISDTGQGISEEDRDKIFEPFFSTKSPDKGTGLGLSTAIASIESFGGKLQLARNSSKGTEFLIHLPTIEPAEKNELLNISFRDKNAPTFMGRILIVEDEEELGSKLLHYFKEQGSDAEWVRDGNEALNYIESHSDSIRLVLLDLVIPGVSGESIAKVLKMKANWIQVVFITGRHDIASQVDDDIPCVLKPFDFDELRAVVDKINLH